MQKVFLAVPVFIGMGFLFVSGCSDSQDASSPKIDDNQPIVTVLGKTLVRSDLSRKAMMVASLIRHRQPNVNEQGLKSKVEKLRQRYPVTFVGNVILSDYAAQKKIEVSESTLKKFQDMAFLRYRGKKDKKFEDICSSLGEYGDDFREQVRAEALGRAVRDYWVQLNPTNIPDSYVDDQLKRFEAYNRSVALTNALTYARATNVWEQLKKGADFGDMAAQYSTLEDERESKGVWGAVDTRQIMDEPNIVAWGKKLEIGQFSPPIEGDNGLMIMRLDDRLDSDQELHISRIYFQLAASRRPASRERILAAAYEKYADHLFEVKFAELRSAVNPIFHESKTTRKENEK